MDTQKHYSWETNSSVHDLISLAGYITRYKWIYLGICSIILAAGLYLYHTHSYYKSRISFLVNSSNVAEVLWDRSGDGPIDISNDDRGYNRINQIMYSTQMLDYLINKFNLYAHYKIPKESEDSYLLVLTTLKEHMGVSIDKTKIITVQITDRLDYNVAADMANAIGKKINDFNRQITVDNLTRKTEMFEILAKDLRNSSNKEFLQIDSLLKVMQKFMTTAVQDASYRQVLTMDIENLKSKSDDYFKNLFESYKYRLYSMYSLQEKNLPTISVLEKALPNKHSKSSNNRIAYPLLVVFSFFMPLFVFYLLMKTIPLAGYVFHKAREQKNSE